MGTPPGYGKKHFFDALFSTHDFRNPLQYLKLVSRPPHTPKIEVFTFLDALEAFEHLLIYSWYMENSIKKMFFLLKPSLRGGFQKKHLIFGLLAQTHLNVFYSLGPLPSWWWFKNKISMLCLNFSQNLSYFNCNFFNEVSFQVEVWVGGWGWVIIEKKYFIGLFHISEHVDHFMNFWKNLLTRTLGGELKKKE
jgi:hypothetical protein